jgi:hypothetical protein
MSEKFYKSIEDIPLFNWVKVNAGEMNFLLINKEDSTSNEELSEAWDILFDDYIEKRGLSKSYKQILNVMKKKAILECDYIVSGDLFKLTEIEIEEQNLKQLIGKDSVDMSVEKSLIILSKWIGYRLDWKIITLNEYYLILKEYGETN